GGRPRSDRSSVRSGRRGPPTPKRSRSARPPRRRKGRRGTGRGRGPPPPRAPRRGAPRESLREAPRAGRPGLSNARVPTASTGGGSRARRESRSGHAARRHADARRVLDPLPPDVAGDQDEPEQDDRGRPAPFADPVPEGVERKVLVGEPERAQTDQDDAPREGRRALGRAAQLLVSGEAGFGELTAIDGLRLPRRR